MTYREYFRELFRLLVGLPSNPVFLATLPWRGGVIAVAWSVICVLFAAGMIAMGSILALTGFIRHQISSEVDEFVAFGMIVAFFAPFITLPISVILSSRRWRDPDRRVDMFMTTLPPRQAAIGSLAMGMLIGLLVPVAAAVGAGIAQFSDLVVRQRNYQWPTFIILSACFGLWTFGVAALIVRPYLRWRGVLWPLFFYLPARSLYTLAVCVYGIVGVIVMIDDDMPGVITGATIPLLLTLWAVRSAGWSAAAAFYSQIESMDLTTRCPFALLQAQWRDRALRVPLRVVREGLALAPARKRWVVGVTFAVLLAVTWVVIEFISHGHAATKLPPFPAHRVLCAWLMAALMIAQVLAREIRMVLSGRPIIAGAPLRSLLLPHLPLLVWHVPAWVLLAIADVMGRPSVRLTQSIVEVAFCGAFPLLVLVLACALALQGLAVRRRHFAVLAVQAGMIVIPTILLLVTGPDVAWRGQAEGFFWEPRVEETLVVMLIMLGIQLYRVPEMLQAMHVRRQLGETPLGTAVLVKG